MIVVLGATGRVGSAVVKKLLEYGQPVRAVVRNGAKAAELKERSVDVEVADFFDLGALKRAFRGAKAVFLLTPENPASEDFLGDTRIVLQNYREAIQVAGVGRIVGLSSFGAQHSGGTGNLEASYMLEHAFAELDAEQTFVRATYYYSNWMGYWDLARESGVLPTFFPTDMKIPMISPADVGAFIADLLAGKRERKPMMEIAGPESYSPDDVAGEFRKALGRPVAASQIPRNEWLPVLEGAGFSASGAKNLALMTDAVLAGKTGAEGAVQYTDTTFPKYLREECE
ncbi:NAD(P)H-binding protein [Synergistaceae bacterium OttesenSCG-928-I11]|nr:NAD(P)H-binding protein [Synergistaceae bacterium OttesenSCG-928-I11]